MTGLIDINEVAEHARRTFADGEIIPWTWLLPRLGLFEPEFCTKEETHQYNFTRMDRVSSFKKAMLIEHKRYLEAVPGKGLVIVPPKETPEKVALKALREYRRAKEKKRFILKHIDESALTKKERKALEHLRSQ